MIQIDLLALLETRYQVGTMFVLFDDMVVDPLSDLVETRRILRAFSSWRCKQQLSFLSSVTVTRIVVLVVIVASSAPTIVVITVVTAIAVTAVVSTTRHTVLVFCSRFVVLRLVSVPVVARESPVCLSFGVVTVDRGIRLLCNYVERTHWTVLSAVSAVVPREVLPVSSLELARSFPCVLTR